MKNSRHQTHPAPPAVPTPDATLCRKFERWMVSGAVVANSRPSHRSARTSSLSYGAYPVRGTRKSRPVGDDGSTAGGHDRRHDQAPDSPAARQSRSGGRDPDRAARVILDVVDLDEPPLRLLLGSYALARAADMIERQSAEDRKWAFLSERTDFQELAA